MAELCSSHRTEERNCGTVARIIHISVPNSLLSSKPPNSSPLSQPCISSVPVHFSPTMKPVVSALNAWSWYVPLNLAKEQRADAFRTSVVVSVAAIIILSVIGSLFQVRLAPMYQAFLSITSIPPISLRQAFLHFFSCSSFLAILNSSRSSMISPIHFRSSQHRLPYNPLSKPKAQS